MQDPIIQKINAAQTKQRTDFRVGDRVSVSVRLKEGDKERIQIFKGVVILKRPKSGKGPHSTFTVRKISEGVGVERIFPTHSPFIDKIEVESSGRVRRSRLFFLRALKGKKARLKETERFGADGLLQTGKEIAAAAKAAAAAAAAAETPKENA